jgi:hypothetical protein
MSKPQEIIIKDFHTEIAKSPFVGFADMRGLFTDVEGRVSLNPALYNDFLAPIPATTVTLDGNSGIISNLGSANLDMRAVTFSVVGGSLPTAFTAPVYYLRLHYSTDTYYVYSSRTSAVLMDGNWLDVSGGSGTLKITSVNPSRFKYIVEDAAKVNLFALDTTCKLWTRVKNSASAPWYYVGGNTQTGTGDPGLAHWRNYIFVFRDAAVDILGPTSSAASSWVWTNSWGPNSGNWLNAIAGSSRVAITLQNDILYFSSGDRVSSINEVAGQTFAFNNSATYNANATALKLPGEIRINKLLPLGDRLASCTNKGVYPWDTTSSSFDFPTLYGQDVKNGIVFGNYAYLFVGDTNSIYVSNLSSSELVRKLPEFLFGSSTIYPGSVMIRRDRIYFGISDSGSSNLDGIWSFDPATKKIKCEHLVSTGAVTNLKLGALFNISDTDFICSWETGNQSSICADSLGSNRNYTSYTAFLISPMYQVGTALFKKAFSTLEAILDRPLTTGQGIKVYYRSDLSASFTLIATYDYTTYSGSLSQDFPIGHLFDLDYIQFKVEITTGSGSSTTPYLKEIRAK